jgi:hypothetical protein
LAGKLKLELLNSKLRHYYRAIKIDFRSTTAIKAFGSIRVFPAAVPGLAFKVPSLDNVLQLKLVVKPPIAEDVSCK